MVAVLMTGCGVPRSGAMTTAPRSDPFALLDVAIGHTNSSRANVLADVAALDRAIGVLDRADQVAATGNPQTARPLVAAETGTAGGLSELITRARSDDGDYRQALGALGTSGRAAPMSPAQHAAVAAVVGAGQAEAERLRASTAAYAAALPAYSSLASDQQVWLGHAVAGWYRTPAESGGAYVVQLDPVAARLATARAVLQATDAPRRAATTRMAGALSAARTALAPLAQPGGAA